MFECHIEENKNHLDEVCAALTVVSLCDLGEVSKEQGKCTGIFEDKGN